MHTSILIKSLIKDLHNCRTQWSTGEYLSLTCGPIVEGRRVADKRSAVDDDGDVVDKQTVWMFLVWR